MRNGTRIMRNSDNSTNQVFSLVRISILVCLLVSWAGESFAQQIKVSQHLDDKGNARSAFLEWTKIGEGPLSLVVQYKAKELIEEPKMYLFIDKRTELHEFIEFDTYKIEVPDSAKSIHRKIDFKELGDYIIAFTDADKKVILADTLKIRARNKVYFCKDYKKYKPVDIRDDFDPTSTGLYYYKVVFEGQEVFNTHQFNMHIYQHDGEGFNTLIGKYKHLVYPSRKKAVYGGPFLDPGKYKMEVYKFNGEPFAEAYFHLKAPVSDDKKE